MWGSQIGSESETDGKAGVGRAPHRELGWPLLDPPLCVSSRLRRGEMALASQSSLPAAWGPTLPSYIDFLSEINSPVSLKTRDTQWNGNLWWENLTFLPAAPLLPPQPQPNIDKVLGQRATQPCSGFFCLISSQALFPCNFSKLYLGNSTDNSDIWWSFKKLHAGRIDRPLQF